MNIYGLTLEEIEELFLSFGSKKFHALQLFSWLYEKRVESFNEMTDIKKEIISKLKEIYSIDRLKIVDVQEDSDVCKYLFELYDGEHIEDEFFVINTRSHQIYFPHGIFVDNILYYTF